MAAQGAILQMEGQVCPSQWSYVSDTLVKFTAALGSISHDAQGVQGRMSSVEQKLNAIEKQQTEVVKLQGKLVHGLGSHDNILAVVKHEVDRLHPVHKENMRTISALGALEHRFDAMEKRTEEESQRAFERSETLTEDCVKVQQTMRTEQAEQAGDVARRLGAMEGEMEACRRTFTEMHSLAGHLQELDTTQSCLQSRLDDLFDSARAQIDQHISGATLRLHQHFAATCGHAEQQIEGLTEELSARAVVERQELAEEYDTELNSMKSTLDLEIHHSCGELSLMLSTWQDGLMKATDTWATHLENMQFDTAFSPHMAREAASGFSDCLCVLSKQLARLKGLGVGSSLDDRWPAGFSDALHIMSEQLSRLSYFKGVGVGGRGNMEDRVPPEQPSHYQVDGREPSPAWNSRQKSKVARLERAWTPPPARSRAGTVRRT